MIPPFDKHMAEMYSIESKTEEQRDSSIRHGNHKAMILHHLVEVVEVAV